MNIIILGCGKVGRKIVERLNSEGDHNIMVIDTKSSAVNETVSCYDIMGVIGNGEDIETLIEAGVQTADLLIAVTGHDELNLLSCVIAKKLGNCRTIARVHKPEYRKALGLLKDDLGLSLAINPEYAAASEIARNLRFPSAIKIDTFAKGRIEILKFRLPQGCILDSMKLSEISGKTGCDVLVCGVERESEVFIPGGNFELREGDLVSIVASIENASHFFKKIGIKTNKVRDTMIIGGGDTAYYLAAQLIKTGIDVKIIDKNTARCEELCQLLPKATIINGDGTENRLLLEEGLEKAESFVTLTNIDEENIMLSLYAKSKSEGKVITKINRIAYDEVIDSLDLGTIISPKDITAEYIVRFVRAMKNSMGCNIETMHLILDEKAEALEFRINEDSPVAGIPLEKLSLRENILVACINRKGKVIIPRGRDVIMPGDTVIIVTLKSGFKDISDILR